MGGAKEESGSKKAEQQKANGKPSVRNLVAPSMHANLRI